MIEEQFVSFDTAKLLKEAGFIEHCRCMYFPDKDDNRLKMCYDMYPKMYNMFMNYTNNGITYREAMRKVLSVNGLELPDEKKQLELF